MLTLFELFGAVFLFIWCENAVSTPILLALHPCLHLCLWYIVILLCYIYLTLLEGRSAKYYLH